MTPGELSWNTSTSPSSVIPPSSLLPNIASSSVSEVLVALTKVSILVQGFSFSLDEITYFYDHGADFASLADQKSLDLNELTLGCWKRLFAYSVLRDSLPKQNTRLIDLYAWSKLPNSADVVTEIVKWRFGMRQLVLQS